MLPVFLLLPGLALTKTLAFPAKISFFNNDPKQP